MSATLVNVTDLARITGGANASTKPVLVGRYNGDGSERVGPGRKVKLVVNRDRDGTTGALDGTIIAYGALLPHAESGNSGMQKMIGSDGATGRTVFTTGLVYAAFSNYNWVVLVNGAVIEQGAGAGKFTVSDSGGFAVITFGTALAVNDTVEIYKVTPVEILATGAHPFNRSVVDGKNVYWIAYAVAATNLSKTRVDLEPAVVS
jgi:hypothetical protein